MCVHVWLEIISRWAYTLFFTNWHGATNFIGKLAPNSSLSQQFPPTPTYNPEWDVPDQTGKVALVTGGNSGIGYHTVKELLLKNAKVYLAARSPTKCEEAVERLREETGGKKPIVLQLDLADLHSVRKAAEEFLNKEERLDILFNSAGIMAPSTELLTVQGYDLQFGTNVLGHYFLSILLLPALERSTAHRGVKARVINTSSWGHEFAPGSTGIEWKAVKSGPERDKVVESWLSPVRRWRPYAASKLGNVLLSNILAKHHGDVVMSCALHPGGLRTNLTQHINSFQRWVLRVLFYPPPLGAYTQLWAGTSPEGEGFNGKYLIPWARIGKANPRAANETTQEKLKLWLEEQVKGF